MDYLDQLYRGIEYIETHIREDVPLKDIAREAGLSEYHFHRTFSFILGETPGEYIRSRRLTLASEELSTSERPILEIAMDYGYDSQAAFSRAFKKMFRDSPKRFRKKHYQSHFLKKAQLDLTQIRHLMESITLEPRFEISKALTLCGLEGPTSKNNIRIGKIWWSLLSKQKKIPNRIDKSVLYGVSEYMDPATFTDDTEFKYFAGAEVTKNTIPPKGFSMKQIPEQKWAIFTHKGDVKTLFNTYNYIYGPWALKSRAIIEEKDDMEYYGVKFKPRDPKTSEIDIYVPIRES